MTLPKTIEDALLDWMDKRDPAWLEEMAQHNQPLLPVLQQEFGPFKIKLLPVMLSAHDQQALREFGRSDWDALLTTLVEQTEAGTVFWNHQRWYHAQMQVLQDFVVSALPAPRGYNASIRGR